MQENNVIRVEARVTEVLSERLYRAELVNGHRFLGFVSPRDVAAGLRFTPGDMAQAVMSPLDLSKARLRK